MFKKIVSNTVAQIFSKVGSAIVAIFLISVLTNYLSVEMYWLYSKVYNYIWIFVFLADLWLYAITIREITNNKNDSVKIVWNVMSLRLILWFFILFLATFIAFFLPWYNSDLALASIIIASVFTIFQLLNSSILALMQANMKIEFSAISLILAKIVNLWLIASIAYFFYPREFIENSDYFTPFLYIMSAWVVSVVFNTLLNYWYARKIVKFWFNWDFKYIKYLFKISLPYWLALFLSVVYFKVDIIILSLMEWPKLGDLSIALYSLPMKIVEVLMVVWWFYMTSLLPSLTKWFKEKNERTLDNLIWISFKILFSAGILIFSLWVLFREYMIRIIANNDYINTTHMFNSSDAFLVVFAVVVFNFLSLVFIYSLVASENQSRLLKINIVVTIFNIVWNILLIPKYSFIWAWITTLLSQMLLTSLWYYYTRKLIKFHLPFVFVIKNLIIWGLFYILWYILITYFSVGLYFDFFVYWWILFWIYAKVLYAWFNKEKTV